MLIYSDFLSNNKSFFLHPTAQSLVETGESMKQIADIKYNLDDNMKMNVIEPLHQLSTKDIKEVQVIKK